MKIDLNKPLYGLDLLPVVTETGGNITCGKVLAQVIAGASNQDSLKFWSWATNFYAGVHILIDLQDYELLYRFVKDSAALTVASKAQILNTLISQKQADDEQPKAVQG